jgi:two-component system chemotaxis response regulator CheY
MGKRILIVDDSALIRQVEQAVLSKAGYETETANSGKEAITKMEGSIFNLVLTDLNMPDLDGVSLIKQVRAGGKHRLTPIVLITTESKDGKKQEGKMAGATAWVVKPFSAEQLLSVVRRVLG